MSLSQDAGTVTKLNLKATPGQVLAFYVTNANAAIRYFQLHNKATAPAGTDVPQRWIQLPAGSATQPAQIEIGAPQLGLAEAFTTGIGWAISTTAATFTDAATAADHTVSVRWG